MVTPQGSGYDWRADMWSFGITLMEMAYGHNPFAHMHPMRALLAIVNNPPPTLDAQQVCVGGSCLLWYWLFVVASVVGCGVGCWRVKQCAVWGCARALVMVCQCSHPHPCLPLITC